MNGLDPKNVIILNSLQKQSKCSDGDFKKQTEIENDNSLLLAVKILNNCCQMKYRRARVMFYLNLLTESGYVFGHNYFICLNEKKIR